MISVGLAKFHTVNALHCMYVHSVLSGRRWFSVFLYPTGMLRTILVGSSTQLFCRMEVQSLQLIYFSIEINFMWYSQKNRIQLSREYISR